MLRHGAAVRAYTAWTDIVGLREGDRYLIVNPFFHCFGLKAGIVASLVRGATIVPHPVFDVPSVMRRVDEEGITMLPGAPAIYQTILDHPELASFDLSTLRLAVTGSATVPVEMIRRMREELTFQHDRHRLRPDRVDRHRHDVPPRRRPRDHRHHGRPGHPRRRGAGGRRGRQGGAPGRARRGGDPGLQRDARLLRRRRRHRRDDRRRRLAPHRRRRRHGRQRQPAHHRPHQGHVHRRRLQRLPGRDREHDDAAPGGRAGGGRSACPTTAWARWARPSWCPGPAPTVDPAEVVAWCREEMANYKVPRSVEVVDALPLNASGKVLKYELRERAAGSSA